jgi:hypothetical protein
MTEARCLRRTYVPRLMLVSGAITAGATGRVLCGGTACPIRQTPHP